MKPLKIVIVGLGLIGGSMAKALKQNTSHQVLGMDQDEDALLDACSCGAIDGKAGRDDLKTADLVYLCVYPEGALAFAREYGPLLKAGSVLTDACGVKEELCAAMAALPGQYTFVAGHPMAGKERSGFAASDPSIFVGASYILVDTGAPDWAMALVRERAEEMGFGRVVRTTPARHDCLYLPAAPCPGLRLCHEPPLPGAPGLFRRQLPGRVPGGEHQRRPVEPPVSGQPEGPDPGAGPADRQSFQTAGRGGPPGPGGASLAAAHRRPDQTAGGINARPRKQAARPLAPQGEEAPRVRAR